jgi:peptidyl-prolyl cis-trans isomerase D
MKFFFIFFWLVIISFIWWGVPGKNDTNRDTVVTIGKYRADIDEYRDTYDRLYDLYKKIYQEKLDDELLKKLDLRKKAIEEIIQRRLLLQEAERIGLKVTDGELRDFIITYPAFQKDGRFNNEIYLRTLELNRLTKEGFEIMQRENLTVEKMKRIIWDSVVVADEELKEYFVERAQSERKPFKEEEFEKVKGVLSVLVLQEKRDKALSSYVEVLRSRKKVIVNEKILGS